MGARRRDLCLLGGALAGAVALAFLAPGGLLRDRERKAAPRAAVDGSAVLVSRAQAYLRDSPRDARVWAELGSGYTERARITGDPAYYPKAQGVLRRSLTLQPTGNPAALEGMATLAAARHDFGRARTWAERTLKADPYRAQAHGVLADAAIESGDYQAAAKALLRMLRQRPGVASFTRLAHLLELRGQPDRADMALRRAAAAATAPSEMAFCRYRLGELAWQTGKPAWALAEYEKALAAQPGYPPALAGRARAKAALGRTDQAVADYTAAVARAPVPQIIVEAGELHLSRGRSAEARSQFALLPAQRRLLRAGGVTDFLTSGRYEADHGDARVAVRQLRTEWGRRRSVEVADALGWALHRAGRHEEALRYARLAGRLGGHNAVFAYHRGAIERALGNHEAARAHLSRALEINPYFSPLWAKRARDLIA